MTIAGDGSASDALLEGVILPALRKVVRVNVAFGSEVSGK